MAFVISIGPIVHGGNGPPNSAETGLILTAGGVGAPEPTHLAAVSVIAQPASGASVEVRAAEIPLDVVGTWDSPADGSGVNLYHASSGTPRPAYRVALHYGKIPVTFNVDRMTASISTGQTEGWVFHPLAFSGTTTTDPILDVQFESGYGSTLGSNGTLGSQPGGGAGFVIGATPARLIRGGTNLVTAPDVSATPLAIASYDVPIFAGFQPITALSVSGTPIYFLKAGLMRPDGGGAAVVFNSWAGGGAVGENRYTLRATTQSGLQEVIFRTTRLINTDSGDPFHGVLYERPAGPGLVWGEDLTGHVYGDFSIYRQSRPPPGTLAIPGTYWPVTITTISGAEFADAPVAYLDASQLTAWTFGGLVNGGLVISGGGRSVPGPNDDGTLGIGPAWNERIVAGVGFEEAATRFITYPLSPTSYGATIPMPRGEWKAGFYRPNIDSSEHIEPISVTWYSLGISIRSVASTRGRSFAQVIG